MTDYAPHTLVQFGGTLNTGVPDHEIWTNTVRVVAPGGSGPVADHTAYLAAIHPTLSAWFSQVAQGFPGSATLEFVKANPIKADGTYRDPTTYLYDYPTAVAGASAVPSIQDILCLAISWSTAKAIRRHSYATHGRIYPPNYAIAPAAASSMRVGSADVAAWAARGTALLHALASTGVPALPIIASNHAGEIEPITGVRVGNVLDVQRRRKSELAEVYSTLPFSLP